MEELLDKFVCTVTPINGTIELIYELSGITGVCNYSKVETIGINKPIRQRFYVMLKCEMGDIIEYIHSIRGISEGDFDEVNHLIRNHSLLRVQSYDR
jgi:hypothetical protein